MHLKSAIHLFYCKYNNDKSVEFAQINENAAGGSRVYQSFDFFFNQLFKSKVQILETFSMRRLCFPSSPISLSLVILINYFTSGKF